MTATLDFFGLEPSDDPHRWSFRVSNGLCSTIGALFGGAGLGAAILALEATTGRPVVWATAQFLSYARLDSEVTLDIIESVRGFRTSQSRVVGRVGGEEIFTVNAASGARDEPWSGTWDTMPPVPAPHDCPPRELSEQFTGTIASRLDTRRANARDLPSLDGTPGDGRAALWVQLPDLEVNAATLAVLGDYVPFGIGQTLGLPVGGNSLDNTIRVAHRQPDAEWVLADVRIHAVADGFGCGDVFLWSQDGTLLAVASQSTILRPFHVPPRAEHTK
ncbi:MAG: acyl-CoA thioesterase [Acidimicrobiia bacterium]